MLHLRRKCVRTQRYIFNKTWFCFPETILTQFALCQPPKPIIHSSGWLEFVISRNFFRFVFFLFFFFWVASPLTSVIRSAKSKKDLYTGCMELLKDETISTGILALHYSLKSLSIIHIVFCWIVVSCTVLFHDPRWPKNQYQFALSYKKTPCG